MLNRVAVIHQDDDTPKTPDPSDDALWSGQAKRYQRLLLGQQSLKSINSALGSQGGIKAA